MKVLVISERDVSTGGEDNDTTSVRGWYNIFTIVVAYGKFLSILCTYWSIMPSLIANAVGHALAVWMQKMNLPEWKSMFNNECFQPILHNSPLKVFFALPRSKVL